MNKKKYQLINSQELVTAHFINQSHKLGHLCYLHKLPDGYLQVRAHDDLRWLLINGVAQTVINKTAPNKLYFPHLRLLANRWQQLPVPKRVLELGLGGGAIHNYLCRCFPGTKVSSFDKSQAIIDCYHQFFSHDSTQNIHCQKAQDALSSSPLSDWIIIDIFSHQQAPMFLFQPSFYQMVLGALSENGHVFINFIAEHPSQLIQLKKVLKAVFQVAPMVEKATHFNNYIIWLDTGQMNKRSSKPIN